MADKWRKVRNLDRSGKIDRDDLKMTVKTYHVVPCNSRGWIVTKSGAHRNSKYFSSQSEAIEHAKKSARRMRMGEIVVHGRDGRILRKDSYSYSRNPHSNSF